MAKGMRPGFRTGSGVEGGGGHEFRLRRGKGKDFRSSRRGGRTPTRALPFRGINPFFRGRVAGRSASEEAGPDARFAISIRTRWKRGKHQLGSEVPILVRRKEAERLSEPSLALIVIGEARGPMAPLTGIERSAREETADALFSKVRMSCGRSDVPGLLCDAWRALPGSSSLPSEEQARLVPGIRRELDP